MKIRLYLPERNNHTIYTNQGIDLCGFVGYSESIVSLLVFTNFS